MLLSWPDAVNLPETAFTTAGPAAALLPGPLPDDAEFAPSHEDPWAPTSGHQAKLDAGPEAENLPGPTHDTDLRAAGEVLGGDTGFVMHYIMSQSTSSSRGASTSMCMGFFKIF